MAEERRAKRGSVSSGAETPAERPGSAARLLLGGTRSKEETLEDILIFQVSPLFNFLENQWVRGG